ncbi:glycosyltransferase [Candidatus Woesearchaeota archaeon]|nr:glycosyltransferase [Candidatus Woesearchaeota archaeon]
MKISIIIPAHNEEAYLENTLESIKKQDFSDYETVVVCNGCTDKTEDVANRCWNDKMKVFSIPEANVSVARNFGAKNSSGKLLLFLDADTLLKEGALNKIVEEFKEGVSVATTKVEPDKKLFKYRLAMGFKNFYNSSGLYEGCSGALICKKDDFHSVGGYPEIKVKEHRKLTIALKKFGEYSVVGTSVITSMRRFDEWGLGKATGFWIKEWAKNYFGDLKKSDYEKIR